MHADSRREFRATQRQYDQTGGKDRFIAPCEPFKHPSGPRKGKFIMPDESFDTTGLGYQYDALVPTPPLRLRERPVLAGAPRRPRPDDCIPLYRTIYSPG